MVLLHAFGLSAPPANATLILQAAVAVGPAQGVAAADEGDGLTVGPAHPIPEGVPHLLGRAKGSVTGMHALFLPQESVKTLRLHAPNWRWKDLCGQEARALSLGERLCTR